jgi:hypothetical protein
MSIARRLRSTALGISAFAAAAGGPLACDEQYDPCPAVDPVLPGEFRFTPNGGQFVDDDLTLARATITEDGIEFRYQRRDEDAPFIVRYEATIQFPDPGDTD